MLWIDAHHVIGHPHGRRELRMVTRRRHRGPDVDGVPQPREGLLIGDELAVVTGVRLTQVVVDEHELAAGKGERRHQLMPALRIVIDGHWIGEVAPVAGGDHHDAGAVAGGRVGDEAALRPRDVEASRTVGRHRGIGVRAEAEDRAALVELFDLASLLRFPFLLAAMFENPVELAGDLAAVPPREAVHLARRIDFLPAIRQARHHHRVLIEAWGFPAWRTSRIGATRRTRRPSADRSSMVAPWLIGSSGRLICNGPRPRGAAIGRSREQDF